MARISARKAKEQKLEEIRDTLLSNEYFVATLDEVTERDAIIIDEVNSLGISKDQRFRLRIMLREDMFRDYARKLPDNCGYKEVYHDMVSRLRSIHTKYSHKRNAYEEKRKKENPDNWWYGEKFNFQIGATKFTLNNGEGVIIWLDRLIELPAQYFLDE